MLIGLVGNVIVVAVITTLRKRGQKAPVQLFFLHLAISDLMVCLLCIPLTIFTNFNYPTEFYERDVGLCKISRFMQVLELLLCISQFEISTPPPSPHPPSPLSTFSWKLTRVLGLQFICISQFELSTFPPPPSENSCRSWNSIMYRSNQTLIHSSTLPPPPQPSSRPITLGFFLHTCFFIWSLIQ